LNQLEDLERGGFRLSSIRVEPTTAELVLEYSENEREGVFVYDFRIPRRATDGILASYRFGLRDDLDAGAVDQTPLSALPARVANDALGWVDEQLGSSGAKPDTASIWNDFRATIQAAG